MNQPHAHDTLVQFTCDDYGREMHETESGRWKYDRVAWDAFVNTKVSWTTIQCIRFGTYHLLMMYISRIY